MTEVLKTELEKLETEFIDVKSQYNEARNAYDTLAMKLAPLEAELRTHEAAMDAVKPRYIELATQLTHLRKAVL